MCQQSGETFRMPCEPSSYGMNREVAPTRKAHAKSLSGNLTCLHWERERKPAVNELEARHWFRVVKYFAGSMERSLRYVPVSNCTAWPSSNKTDLLRVPYRISFVPPTNCPPNRSVQTIVKSRLQVLCVDDENPSLRGHDAASTSK